MRLRMKDPLLLGSAAVLPGTSLQKACKLLVFFCALHLTVTLVYYVSGGELSFFQYFTENQQRQNANRNLTTGGPPLFNLSKQVISKTMEGQDLGTINNGLETTTNGLKTTTARPPLLVSTQVPGCPENSPLLGKNQSYSY